MKPNIYFDLDDVAADFVGYVNKVSNTTYRIGEIMSDSEWAELRVNHQRLFADLEMVWSTKNVITTLCIQKYNVAFLTALPFDGLHPWKYAPIDKLEWVKLYYPKVPCFFGPYSHDKKNYCQPGDILIDDKESNCEEWKAAGGISHLYRDYKGLLMFLQENGI